MNKETWLMRNDAIRAQRRILMCSCGTKWVTEYDNYGTSKGLPFSIGNGTMWQTFDCICGLRHALNQCKVVSCAEAHD